MTERLTLSLFPPKYIINKVPNYDAGARGTKSEQMVWVGTTVINQPCLPQDSPGLKLEGPCPRQFTAPLPAYPVRTRGLCRAGDSSKVTAPPSSANFTTVLPDHQNISRVKKLDFV